MAKRILDRLNEIMSEIQTLQSEASELVDGKRFAVTGPFHSPGTRYTAEGVDFGGNGCHLLIRERPGMISITAVVFEGEACD